jgi:hypothetical protein
VLHQLLSTDGERTTGGSLDNAVHVPLPFPSLYAVGKDASDRGGAERLLALARLW